MHQLDCAGLHEYSGGFGRFSDTRSHCLTEKGSVAAFTEGKLGLFMTNSCSALFLEKHPFWIPLKEPRRVLSTELHLSSVSACSCTRKVHLVMTVTHTNTKTRTKTNSTYLQYPCVRVRENST